jgi:hypothetical protein
MANSIFKTFVLCSLPFLHLKASTLTDSLKNATAQPIKYSYPSWQYVHVDIENDMLIPRDKTDRYFSSGVKVDYYFLENPSDKLFVGKVFPKTKSGNIYVGVSGAMNMYTPANISDETMKPGDRPYAGWAYLGLSGISNDVKNAIRFVTEYSVGVIGPAAQQEYFQRGVHQIISRPLPKGWKNQIANDIAINLSFTGEKRIFKPSDNVELMYNFETNIGTVTNYLGMGGTLRIGWFDDYFKDILQLSRSKNWQLYAFARPAVRVVADNSLLQGGMFTYYKSPYVIAKDDLKRIYFNTEFGYTCTYRNLSFTYSQNLRTSEFKGAKNMFWGAISCTLGF